jgi:hypothetical protein
MSEVRRSSSILLGRLGRRDHACASPKCTDGAPASAPNGTPERTGRAARGLRASHRREAIERPVDPFTHARTAKHAAQSARERPIGS